MPPDSSYYAWGDVIAVGLACDIAGAMILAASFMNKRAAAIRREVPRTITSAVTYGGPATAAFPQDLALSMCRQRAEALVGGAILVLGFALQATAVMVDSARLSTTAQRLTALLLAVLVWLIALLVWLTVIPWLARRFEADLERHE